jgi:hypothetical protein
MKKENSATEAQSHGEKADRNNSEMLMNKPVSIFVVLLVSVPLWLELGFSSTV